MVRLISGVLLALSAALVLAVPAWATVRKVAFTATVSPNETASLTVRVAPSARCTIEVIYDTVVSRAAGLGPKTGGLITWRWKVGGATHAGRWPVIVRWERNTPAWASAPRPPSLTLTRPLLKSVGHRRRDP
jgi:hypothetical protein